MKPMPTFREKVYSITKKIPTGKVATYGQIAEIAGNPRAARAVGIYMKQNPDSTTIPCHRVVASNGKLTGYAFGGTAAKKAKLVKEGVRFIGERVNLKVSKM